MEYQLAFAPDLGVRSSDFVTEWNENPECRAKAEASLGTSGATYDPLMDGAIAVLVTLGGGIATNAIYDLLKGWLIKKGVRKQTHIAQIDKPDGTHILIVKIDEE